MKNTTIVLAIIVGATLHGCHKGGNNNNTTYINVNAALKAAFDYKVGTYWIYEDSLSGEVDSFFVFANSDSYFSSSSCQECPVTETESIAIDINEYVENPISLADTQYWEYFYSSNEISVEYENRIYSNTIDYAPFINYPYDSIISGGSVPYSDTGRIIDIFNQFNINGQIYSNVIEVNHFANLLILSTDYIHNDTLYFAPSTGMIKMILNHPLDSLNKKRIWQLQRYNLVK